MVGSSSSLINSSPRSSSRRSANKHVASQTYKIITQYGDMLVVKQGIQHYQTQNQFQAQQTQTPTRTANQNQNPNQQQNQTQEQASQQSRPIIMTFHDLGLNSELQFARFCDTDEVRLMLQTFTMIHINFIGQEFACPPSQCCNSLPDDFRYPSVEQMAESIVDVCSHLRVRSFIALAVGAGAHVASLLALMRPDLVDGLFLINPVVGNCSITEWLYFKMSAIASSHHLGGSTSSESPHYNAEEGPALEGAESASPPSPHRSTGSSQLRRLLHAAHLHIPHYSHGRRAKQHDELQPDESHAEEPAAGSPARNKAPASFKLRHLILSKNFRLASSNSQQAAAGHLEPLGQEAPSSESLAGSDAAEQTGARHSCNKRAPYEYLMYHHFGPATFQRYRRSSDSPARRASCDGSSASQEPDEESSKRSNESLAARSSARKRSGSAEFSAAYLAGIASERQRHAYMQRVYRHHFGQLNAHNLWLFAQSFAKRRTLNLRKDCGAAAHAAAAAATLGTSIYSAFVGVAPAPPPPPHGARPTGGASEPAGSEQPQPASSDERQRLSRKKSRDGSDPNPGPSQAEVGSKPAALNSANQAALVAGTKVKRTFTCQTLIMCSSVQMHCERSFKLMSLLNPLQATWIKTDHLLVLEERPDKVCQALRLFLQGIGYSMSTYERRLRLNSATDSATSSVDSNNSSKSLS